MNQIIALEKNGQITLHHGLDRYDTGSIIRGVWNYDHCGIIFYDTAFILVGGEIELSIEESFIMFTENHNSEVYYSCQIINLDKPKKVLSTWYENIDSSIDDNDTLDMLI